MVCLGGSRLVAARDDARTGAHCKLGGDRTCRSSPIGGCDGHLRSLSFLANSVFTKAIEFTSGARATSAFGLILSARHLSAGPGTLGPATADATRTLADGSNEFWCLIYNARTVCLMSVFFGNRFRLLVTDKGLCGDYHPLW